MVSKKPGGPNTKDGGLNESQWNIVHAGYARDGFGLFTTFFSHQVPNTNADSSGIWTLAILSAALIPL